MTRRVRGRLVPTTAPSMWPDPDRGPFRIRLYWDLVDGRPECVGLELTSIRNPEMPMVEGWREGRSDLDAVKQSEPGWWSPKGWEPKPTPLSTTDLRRLTLSTWISETKRMLADSLRARALYGRLDRSDTDPTEYAELADATGDRPSTRGRRPLYPPAHYARVAEVYARAVYVGSDARREVAETWAVSPTAAAKWIARARELGFLQPTERGKAGGVPAELLERIIAETEEGEEDE